SQAVRSAPDRPVVARAGDHVVASVPPEAHEGVGVLNGNRREEQAVDHAEERRVGADTERQREDNDRRPALVAEQDAKRVAQVLEHRTSSDGILLPIGTWLLETAGVR